MRRSKILKQRLDFVIADVRGILDMSLPRDKGGCLLNWKYSRFVFFVATNKPYNLFDQDGPEYTIATNSVARCFRTLAKLRKAEKITDKESSMPEARSKKPHPDPIITPDPAKLTPKEATMINRENYLLVHRNLAYREHVFKTILAQYTHTGNR